MLTRVPLPSAENCNLQLKIAVFMSQTYAECCNGFKKNSEADII